MSLADKMPITLLLPIGIVRKLLDHFLKEKGKLFFSNAHLAKERKLTSNTKELNFSLSLYTATGKMCNIEL